MPRREQTWKAMRSPSFVHKARHGVSFELVPGEYIDQLIYVQGIFERRFLDGLQGYFRRHPGDVMLDVGCNIGNHSCFLAKDFRAVHSFDPNPIIIKRLHTNITLNGLSNITAHSVGLGCAEHTLYLNINVEGNLGGSFLTNTAAAKSLAVPIVMGDDIVSKAVTGKVDFLKIDVEGHELPALQGLARTIARDRPIVAFEFHAQDRPADEWQEILKVLDGYVLAEPLHAPADSSVLQRLRWHLKQCGRPLLERITQPQARSYHNILAFPSESEFMQFNASYPRP
jgi:FkbM family methyltransferase